MMEPLEPYQSAASDAELRRRAARRIKRKQELRQHVISYSIVIGALWIIWALTSRAYPWPIWPMLGWGIGLAFHAMSLRNHQVSEEQIAAEAAKLSSSPTPAGPQDRV